MRHFVVHVLTESKLVSLNTNLDQEEVDTAQEVTESLVINDALCNSIANSHDDDLCAALELYTGGQEVQLDILDIIKARMILVFGINKVLNLSQGEFTEDLNRSKSSNLASEKPLEAINLPDAKQTRSRRDFVTERATDGCRCKRHFVVVELQELLKVKELTLSSLWAKITIEMSCKVAIVSVCAYIDHLKELDSFTP